jgi:hypothetical protein
MTTTIKGDLTSIFTGGAFEDLEAIISPTLSIPAVTQGAEVTATITGGEDTAENDIYIQRAGVPPWELGETITGNGDKQIALNPGDYFGKVISKTEAAQTIGLTDPVFFRVVAEGVSEAQYKVVGMLEIPGSPKKTLKLKRLEKPIVP